MDRDVSLNCLISLEKTPLIVVSSVQKLGVPAHWHRGCNLDRSPSWSDRGAASSIGHCADRCNSPHSHGILLLYLYPSHTAIFYTARIGCAPYAMKNPGGASQQKMRFTSSSSLILSRVLYCSGLPRYNFLRMAWYSCRFQVSGSCATLCPPLPHALDRWTGRHADRCYSGGTRDNSTIIVSLWQNVTLTLQHKNASEIYERSSGYRRRLGRRRCHG